MIHIINSLIGRQRVGGLILNASREAIFLNQRASNLINQMKQVSFREQILRHRHEKEDEKFDLALKKSNEKFLSTTLYWEDESLRSPCRIDVMPIYDHIEAQANTHALSILVFESLYLEEPCFNKHFKEMYQLTPTEIDLVKNLLDGLTLGECSEAKGRTQSTIRWTLRNVFAKTKTSSQRELIELSRLYIE